MDDIRTDGALYEHRFWLQILGDHARFILDALSPKETADIQKAQYFISTFDRLLGQARSATASADLMALNKEALNQTMALRSFKLDLLARLLYGRVNIMFTPTFLNHMVNELDEYVRILQALQAGQPVPHFDPLHHDLLWLPDAAGHAGAIASDLDAVEKRLIKQSREYMKHFEALYLKAIEMSGYIRTNRRDFPAFRKFHSDIDLEMRLFVRFLSELEEMELSAEVLDRISPLLPDHMMREEWYYLSKLANSGLVPAPNGDPTKPRVER
ncbi:DUF2935 domain-containing protein [Cohnella sp. CFH 77786]|uniref:DUF2935 domain-containing protein n=1 Tax=Cohnella sp. CFH 77786 TaxID=2662265 RepID=UPI001C60FEE9|nr:DUF2935 domain-containing protein [Cohnella sp. CFH 77786]MBW5448125.1 DUF2935 domain-containing protein [Cohnella sp. CFH 77786]